MREHAIPRARLTTVGPLPAIQLADGSLWIKIAAPDPNASQPTKPPRPLKGWRTIRELTEELRFCSEEACRCWLRRHGIPNVRRGRFMLVDGLDVDRALRGIRRR